MTLAEYFKSTRGAAIALARSLGVSHSTVSRWASGEMEPSLATCARIEKQTGGKVKVGDLVAQAASRRARLAEAAPAHSTEVA